MIFQSLEKATNAEGYVSLVLSTNPDTGLIGGPLQEIIREDTMLHFAVAVVFGGVFGFAAGRIKNSTKLAAIKADLEKAEATVTTDVKALIAKIKTRL
jgi:hypothetical protein